MDSPLYPCLDFDAVVIAASLGGMNAVRQVLRGVPETFPVPILVALHRGPTSNYAAQVLGGMSLLPVADARPFDVVRAGRVYLAPAGRHLRLRRHGGRLRCFITDEARVNFARPSADLLFSSAAHVLGDRVLAITLTGLLDDGARGAADVHAAGGVTLVQDPDTARARGMPESVIRRRAADFVLPLEQISPMMRLLVERRGLRAIVGVPIPTIVRTN